MYFSTVVFLTLISLSWGYRCPGTQWVARRGSQTCYYIYQDVQHAATPSTDRKTFTDAMEECRALGGTLATFEHEEEMDYIKSRLPGSSAQFWIGLTYDYDQEKTGWIWNDGTSVTPFQGSAFPSLVPHLMEDPDLEGKRYAATLKFRDDTKSLEPDFQDQTTRHGFICKGSYNGRPLCRSEYGWSYDNGHCYLHVAEFKSFSSAQAHCREKEGYVATINSEREDDWYKKWVRSRLRKNKAWLGITIPNKRNETTADHVLWQDGTPLKNTTINHWPISDMDDYIRDLPNDKSYCGVMDTRRLEPVGPGVILGQSGKVDYMDVHEWQMTTECESSSLPFACETALSKCPYGWEELGDICYQFNGGEEHKKSWEEAEKICQDGHSQLAMIKTTATQIFLRKLLDSKSDSSHITSAFWIGAISRKSQPGIFHWADGTPVMFTNWTTPDAPFLLPSTGGDEQLEHCVFLDGTAGQSSSGNWNITHCAQKMNFICAADHKADILPPDVAIRDVVCPQRFIRYHDGCYLFGSQRLSHETAQNYCQKLNKSSLLTIDSLGQNIHISKHLKNDSWIGIRAVKKSVGGQDWIFQNDKGQAIAEAAFMNLLLPPHFLQFDKRECLFMVVKEGMNLSSPSIEHLPRDAGKWFNDDCSALKNFVCHHDGVLKDKEEYPQELDDPACGPGWFRNGDHCYLINDDAMSYSEAQQHCRNMADKAELLSITTKDEQLFFRSLTSGSHNLSTLIGADSYWLGLQAERVSQWYWQHRSSAASSENNRWTVPFAVFNWAEHEPNPATITTYPQCGYMAATEDASWYSANCSTERASICKKPARVSDLTTLLPIEPVSENYKCPKDFVAIADMCILYNRTLLQWRDAGIFCHSKGAELVSIPDQATYSALQPFIQGAWIGLNSVNDSLNPRVFTWSDRSLVTFTPWSRNSERTLIPFYSLFDLNCVAGTTEGVEVYPCKEGKLTVCATSKREAGVEPVPNPIPPSAGCGHFGVSNGDKDNWCYYPTSPSASRPLLTFAQGRTYCQTHHAGADLVRMSTRAEVHFVSSVVGLFAADYWIGLKERDDPWDSVTEWVDGSDVVVSNWAGGEPKPGILGCVAAQGTFSGGRSPGQWYVDDCEARKFALCKGPREGFELASTTAGPNANGCPSGWITDSGHSRCFKVFSPTASGASGTSGSDGSLHRATWDDAEDFCSRYRSGHLASIRHEREETLIYSALTHKGDKYQYWLGLRLVGSSTEDGVSRWQWSDGSAYAGLNPAFSAAETTSSDSSSCVAMDSKTGSWLVVPCHQSRGWVCQVQRGAYLPNEEIPPLPTAVPTNETCGEEEGTGKWFFIEKSGECLFVSERVNTWASAKMECHTRGSQLAVLNRDNFEGVGQITSHLLGTTQVWIGLRSVNLASNEHQWVDGSDGRGFDQWEIGQPGEGMSETYCTTLNGASGRWRDVSCVDNFPFVCLTPQSGVLAPPTVNPSLGGCRDGWQEFRGYCYMVRQDDKRSFQNALNVCQREVPGGNLVSVGSRLENDFLVTILRHDQTNPTYWIGLREDMGSGPNGWRGLEWTDHSPYTYSNWHATYIPSNAAMPLKCVGMLGETNKAGRWKDQPCSKLNGYICKARKDQALSPASEPSTKVCPEGYRHYGTACFAVRPLELRDGGATWEAARQECTTVHADPHFSTDIATISDIYENAFIGILVDDAARDHETGQAAAWIGMMEVRGNYQWHNSCPATFTSLGSLIGTPEENYCLYMEEGKWWATYCDNTEISHVVCEHRIVSCPTVTIPTNGYCPANFPADCATHCYYIDAEFLHDNRSTKMGFSEARQKCLDIGGDLAAIRTKEDNQCIQAHAHSANNGMFIGLVETLDEVTGNYSWAWLDQEVAYEPSLFSNWAKGEPSKPSRPTDEREQCTEMYPNGLWNNVDCSARTKRGYVCQTPKIFPETSAGPLQPSTIPLLPTPSKVPRPSTERPVEVTTAQSGSVTSLTEEMTKQTSLPVAAEGGNGLSNGAIAGIVIACLIAVSLMGAIAFVVLTGKVASTRKAVREMPVHFIPRRFRNSPQDKVRLQKDTDNVNPNYTGFENANADSPQSYT
ncbi:hypothetical protein RvY_02778 [Ramazzottius varieornatus]|uniref:C-type lectin domain-containing protein n=1 Tax=Ramazzottius varieornatus TaxID=947166 RepID=A0A1D1ULN4_RAMVA|nr:hypothetical protein RvY_02778 [Ramazzottius varieornatus]